jgi:hypothetical protein
MPTTQERIEAVLDALESAADAHNVDIAVVVVARDSSGGATAAFFDPESGPRGRLPALLLGLAADITREEGNHERGKAQEDL